MTKSSPNDYTPYKDYVDAKLKEKCRDAAPTSLWITWAYLSFVVVLPVSILITSAIF